ncbi:MAG: sporulation inhibitor of replication protein SirA [Bacilli bacterium]|nr:sporulation inhibitor of replication protein SirA [Bacilli bacterium]
MRTFYIFKINKEFKIITKNKPYNLYLALDNIHNMDRSDVLLATRLYEEVCDKNDVISLNMSIFNHLSESDYYTKFNNAHIINNYFTDESSKLTVNKTYLKLKTTLNNPTFFETLKNIPNLFVVDFTSRDYFWLS